MQFVAQFNIDNAAFEEDGSEEAARILRKLADTIETGPRLGEMEHNGESVSLFDVNGNRIGTAQVTD